MRVRFVYRPGVEDEIAKERRTLESLQSSADRIKSAAQGYAPVRTGRYRSSISSRIEGGIALAVASAPYARYIEWGTNDTPTMHPLARAAASVARSS
jgi:hypothetical protein